MSDNEFVQLPVRLPLAQRRRLKLFATQQDTSMNALILRAVEQILKDEPASKLQEPVTA